MQWTKSPKLPHHRDSVQYLVKLANIGKYQLPYDVAICTYSGQWFNRSGREIQVSEWKPIKRIT